MIIIKIIIIIIIITVIVIIIIIMIILFTHDLKLHMELFCSLNAYFLCYSFDE
jgi:hypothetical protein